MFDWQVDVFLTQTYLAAKFRKALTDKWKGLLIHNMPVQDIKLVVGQGFLQQCKDCELHFNSQEQRNQSSELV